MTVITVTVHSITLWAPRDFATGFPEWSAPSPLSGYLIAEAKTRFTSSTDTLAIRQGVPNRRSPKIR